MTNLRRFVSAVIASSLIFVGFVAAPAVAAGPDSPAGLNSTALQDGTIHFEWDAAPGASAYRVEWSADDSFASGSVSSVDTYSLDHITRTQPTALESGVIYWRVSSFGSGTTLSSLGSHSGTSTVASNGAVAPLLLSPENADHIGYPDPTVFSWTPVIGAVSYELEYTSDTLGVSGNTTETVSGTRFAPTDPLPRIDSSGNPHTWKWRVRAQHYNGTTTPTAKFGPWSPEREFQISWDSEPTNLKPADEITSIHSDMKFSWNAVPGATKYRVTLGDAVETSGSTTTILSPTKVDVLTTTYIPTAQVSDKTRFWQVTPFDSAGNLGAPSAVHQYKKKWGMQDGPSWPTDPGLTQPQGLTGSASAAGAPQMYMSDYEIAWEPVPRATFYDLEVYDGNAHVWTCRTASTSATIVKAYHSGNDNSGNGTVLKGADDCLAETDVMEPGETYSWRVRGVDYTGSSTTSVQQGSYPAGTLFSSWSANRHFVLRDPEDRAVPQTYSVGLDLDAFEEDNPTEVEGQPAPLMSWNRSVQYVPATGEEPAKLRDAPGYEVSLYKNADFTSEIATFLTPSNKLRLNGVLNDNTTGNPYYARVRPIDPGSNWKSSSYIVIGGIDNYSADSFEWEKESHALSGLAATTLSDGSKLLSWDPQSVTGLLDGGSRGYQVRIYNGSEQLGITKKVEFPFFMAQKPAASNDTQFPSTSTDILLVPGSDYSFDVAPLDANGNPGRSTKSAKFSVGISTPQITEPADVMGGAAALTWSTVPGALNYSIQYRRVGAAAFSSPKVVSQTATVLSGLDKGNYEWKVLAKDASNLKDNVSTYSELQQFSVGDDSVALQLDDAVVLPLDDRVVHWSSAVRGAARYQVQLAEDAQFSSNLKSYETVGTVFALPDTISAGKQYYWRVRALAEPSGSSSSLRILATSASDTFSVRTAPGKVAKPKIAVAGNGLTASWTLLTGANTGSDAPISYVVAYREKTADGDWSGATEVQTNTSVNSYTASSLVVGTQYEFRVAARNSEGTGPWSDVVVGTTPTAPTAAPSLTATAKLKELSLKIGAVAGSKSGGSPITKYRLSYKHISSSTWTKKDIPVGSSYTLSGLNAGWTYQVSVAAINAVGVGPASEVSMKTLALSTAPRSVKVARADKSAKVTWWAPSPANGTVTGFVIQKRVGTSGTWGSAGTVSASTRSYTVKGLSNGKKYQIRIAAKTSVGTGAYSSAVSVTPAGKPATPSKPKAVSSSKGVITVSWAKAPTNGSATKSYTVQYSTSGKTWYTLAKTGASTYKVNTTKGTRGKKVYFRVIVTNYMGSSSPSSSTYVTRK